jgi:hypothetical protein
MKTGWNSSPIAAKLYLQIFVEPLESLRRVGTAGKEGTASPVCVASKKKVGRTLRPRFLWAHGRYRTSTRPGRRAEGAGVPKVAAVREGPAANGGVFAAGGAGRAVECIEAKEREARKRETNFGKLISRRKGRGTKFRLAVGVF